MSLIYEVKGLFEQRTDLVSKHDSWEEIELEKVVKIQNGYPFKSELFNSEGKGFPLIRIRDILKGESETFFNGDYPIEFIVRNGDLIIGMDGDFNSDLWKGNDALLNQRVCRLIPNEKYILKKFVAYGIGGYLKVINENTSSTTVKHLSSKSIGEIPFPLPPLPEQHRIVAKLDMLFGHLDALKTRLDRIPQLLKAFRQSVLTQAVTGKLTEVWREVRELKNNYLPIDDEEMREPTFEIPLEWEWLSFSSVATIKSNLVDPNKYLDYPLIAPDNIQSETGRLINKPLVSDINPISSKHCFDKGVIVYSKIRPYLSKLIIADFKGLCSADMYPIISDLDIRYLFFYMLSEHFLSYANTAGERTVLPKINQKGMNIIPVPVPSLEEQQEIVRRVESLFAKVDRIEAQYQNLKAKIEQLPQALLSKAFRGELVEQLPEDGDARELLEEIKKMKTGGERSTTKKQRILRGAQDGTELKQVAEPEERYGK